MVNTLQLLVGALGHALHTVSARQLDSCKKASAALHTHITLVSSLCRIPTCLIAHHDLICTQLLDGRHYLCKAETLMLQHKSAFNYARVSYSLSLLQPNHMRALRLHGT